MRYNTLASQNEFLNKLLQGYLANSAHGQILFDLTKLGQDPDTFQLRQAKTAIVQLLKKVILEEMAAHLEENKPYGRDETASEAATLLLENSLKSVEVIYTYLNEQNETYPLVNEKILIALLNALRLKLVHLPDADAKSPLEKIQQFNNLCNKDTLSKFVDSTHTMKLWTKIQTIENSKPTTEPFRCSTQMEIVMVVSGIFCALLIPLGSINPIFALAFGLAALAIGLSWLALKIPAAIHNAKVMKIQQQSNVQKEELLDAFIQCNTKQQLDSGSTPSFFPADKAVQHEDLRDCLTAQF